MFAGRSSFGPAFGSKITHPCASGAPGLCLRVNNSPLYPGEWARGRARDPRQKGLVVSFPIHISGFWTDDSSGSFKTQRPAAKLWEQIRRANPVIATSWLLRRKNWLFLYFPAGSVTRESPGGFSFTSRLFIFNSRSPRKSFQNHSGHVHTLYDIRRQRWGHSVKIAQGWAKALPFSYIYICIYNFF